MIWRITFNEAIKDYAEASDFILSGDGIPIEPVLTIGFGVSIAASRGGISDFNGDVTLGFADTHDIQDVAGNLLTDTTPNGTNDNTFALDNTP